MLRSALRPARPLRWVAVPALVVLLGTLVVLARLADGDPAVRLRDDLAAAGFEQVDVSTSQALPNDGEGDAAWVDVRYDSELGVEGERQLGDQILRFVWTRYEGRLGAVSITPVEGQPRRRKASELRRQLGPRPNGRSGALYSRTDRSGQITALAALAVLMTGVLVVCSALAAVIVLRAGRSGAGNARGPDPS